MSQFDDRNEEGTQRRLYSMVAVGIVVALLCLRFFPDQEWLSIAALLIIIFSIITIWIMPFFNRKTKQTEEVHSEESRTTQNEVPESDERREEYSRAKEETKLTTMIEIALHSMQCNTQGEQRNGGGIIYQFNFQGSFFVVDCLDGEESHWCRIGFPSCYNVPVEDYNMAHELCTQLSWRCIFVKAWCEVEEEAETPCVQFHLYADLPWMNDVRGFVDLFRSVVPLFFEDRQRLHDAYSKRKFDQKLESIDISETIHSANSK